ncbi:MAG: transporter [Deltaproteobacteria bacterium]|nr:transporter [Deltaproteobacteria bacterium]
MKRFTWIIGSVAILLMTTVENDAQADDYKHALISDRPDTAEASYTVGKYRLQVETSFALTHDRAAGVTTRAYNFPTLLRFGLNEWLEVRAEGDTLQFQTETGAGTTTGFTDTSFGAKVHLQENEGIAPSVGILAHVALPTGRDAFSTNTVEPEAKVAMDWELPQDFSLGTNVGLDLPAQDAAGDKYLRFLYAVALNHPFPWWRSEQFRFFIEFAGAEPTVSGKDGEHTFDAGLAYFITPNVQVDTFMNVGLTDAAPDFATGLGLCMRF